MKIPVRVGASELSDNSECLWPCAHSEQSFVSVFATLARCWTSFSNIQSRKLYGFRDFWIYL